MSKVFNKENGAAEKLSSPC